LRFAATAKGASAEHTEYDALIGLCIAARGPPNASIHKHSRECNQLFLFAHGGVSKQFVAPAAGDRKGSWLACSLKKQSSHPSKNRIPHMSGWPVQDLVN
jgi:hypothetical protein